MALGLSASDNIQEYLIGSEGAGLTSDTYIAIKTEWFDHDGRPLPADLPGYSGTLAKIVGDQQLNTDSACTSNASPISIKPGSRIQLLKLGDNCDLGTEHYYVYVCGHNRADAAQDKCFNFNNTNAIGRPQYYVPVKVPFYDEVASRRQYSTYRYSKEDEILDEEAEAPQPQYRWHYRPEMQFSVFDLAMEQINVVRERENNQQDIIDLLSQDTPVFGSDADYAQLLLNLLINEGAPLENFGPDRDLVFALGEEEVLATFGEDQTLQFSNIDHLASLQPEDWMTLRLYANNDSANILWEFAFEYINLFATEKQDELNEYTENKYLVTADDPTIELNAILVAQANYDEADQEPILGRWVVLEGDDVSFEPEYQNISDGSYTTTLTMPHQAFSKAKIAFVVDQYDIEVAFEKEITVLPGEVANISLNLSGSAYVQNKGNMNASALVTDAFGNAVIDGTTYRYFVNGDAFANETNEFTVNGVAGANISGGYFAGNNNTVTVEAGEISTTRSFSVQPLDIDLGNIPTTVATNQVVPITLRVTAGGEAADAVAVGVQATKGRIQYADAKTNAAGQLTVYWDTGPVFGEAALSFRTSGDERVVLSVPVLASASGGSNNAVVLVADASSGSVVYDSVLGQAPYNANNSRVLSITGDPNSTATAILGSLERPNRIPLFQIKGRVDEDVNGNAEFSRSVVSSPGVANSFKKRIIVEGAIDQDNGEGNSGASQEDEDQRSISMIDPISLENIKVVKRFSTGDDYQGVLAQFDEIEISLDNSILRLEIQATSGSQIYEIGSIGANTLNILSLSKIDDVYEVYLNGSVQEIPASGTLSDGQLSELHIGSGDRIYLEEFTIYDNSAAQVLAFSDGMETSSVQLDQSGVAQVAVSALQNDLGRLKVVIPANIGDSRHEIVVSSSAAMSQIAGKVANATRSSVTDAQIGQIFDGYQKFDDPAFVNEAIVALVDDQQQFGQAGILSAILNQLEDVRTGSYLKSQLSLLQTFFFENEEHEPLIFAIRDILGGAISSAVRGDTSELRRLETPITVMVEMLEVGGASSDYFASSVQSKEDLRSWFNIMSVPANGWVGINVPVPDVEDVDCSSIPTNVFPNSRYALPSRPCRVSGEIMSDWIQLLAVSDNFFSNNQKEFLVYLKKLYEALPYASSDLRKNIFSTPDDFLAKSTSQSVFPTAHAGATALLKPLKWLGKLGTKGMRNYAYFLMGKSNHRVEPLKMLFIMGYLTDRVSEDGECIGNCIPITDANMRRQIISKINSVNRQAAAIGRLKQDTQNGRAELDCSLASFSHGTMFELMVIAFYHAMHEAGVSQYEILDIERELNIKLLWNKSRGGLREWKKVYTRYSDIVI